MPTILHKAKPVPVTAVTPTNPAPAGPASSPQAALASGFLKTGHAAYEALAEAEAKAELSKDQANRPWRFRIEKANIGKDYLITFLDGALDPTTHLLDLKITSEHTLQVGGKWQNFVCLQTDGKYCPLCVNGSKADVVAVFTVVDHTPYTIKNGPKAGKVIENQRKLLVVKQGSLGHLQKLAGKYGGLKGMQMEVSRSPAKTAAAIGDSFLPQQQFSDQELQDMLGKDANGVPQWLPFDYQQVMPIYTLEQLTEMGLGSSSQVIGNEPATDFSNKL